MLYSPKRSTLAFHWLDLKKVIGDGLGCSADIDASFCEVLVFRKKNPDSKWAT